MILRYCDHKAAEFDNYVSTIGSTRLVGPAYAIIGGPSVGQGSVLTLGPNMTQPIDDWRIPQGLPSSADSADKFYVLEVRKQEVLAAVLESYYDCYDYHELRLLLNGGESCWQPNYRFLLCRLNF